MTLGAKILRKICLNNIFNTEVQGFRELDHLEWMIVNEVIDMEGFWR